MFKHLLPNSDFIYSQNKPLFEMNSAKKNDKIELSNDFFYRACEKPIAAFRPTFSGLFLGFLEPFRYKLYLETLCYITLFFCINSLYFIVFGNTVFSQFICSFTFFFTYLFFMNYSKAMWARKVYDILLKEMNAIEKLPRNLLIKKIKPHSIITTFTIGFAYVIFIVGFNLLLLTYIR